MPLVVFSYQGGIYTIGETDKYDYSCKLAVERILKIEMLDEKFKRKTTIDIPWIMTDPFGLVQIDQFEAEIMIPKDSVERIMDKAWPEKRVRFSSPSDDGSVVMTVITSGEFELVRWNKPPTGTQAYAISRSGAEEFLRRRSVFFRPIDVDLQFTWETGIDVVGLEPQLCKISDAESTIGGRKLKPHYPAARLIYKLKYAINSLIR